MKTIFLTIPNIISLTRIFLAPLVYFLLSVNNKIALTLILVFVGLTDAVDGFIARKLKQDSNFGAKLDSCADIIYYAIFIFWFLTKYYQDWHIYFYLSVLPIALILLAQIITQLRFRAFASFHLYSIKASAMLAYLTVVCSLLFGFNKSLIQLLLIFWSIASLETLITSVMIKKIQYNIKSVFLLK